MYLKFWWLTVSLWAAQVCLTLSWALFQFLLTQHPASWRRVCPRPNEWITLESWLGWMLMSSNSNNFLWYNNKKMVFVNSYWYNAPKTFLGNKSVACILIRWLTEERGLSNFKMKTGHKKDQAMIRKLALSVLLLYLPWKKRGAGDWVWSPIANDLISYAYVLKPP